jgi:ubiquinone/menaquinone biosynthesis C-methylase UbiE
MASQPPAHPPANEQRAAMLDRWERAAAGWGRRAPRIRDIGMPVSAWMIEHLELHPGQRVLELASGPGDTGFMAAELLRPGGTLVCSDAASALLDVARGRAAELGIDNVEFRELQLEWIDLPTASVDAVLCRWGFMLLVDPAAAFSEARRVVRPGGRIALAVWDAADVNPWATVSGRALIELGFAEPPDPNAPGMFALARPGQLQEMLESAGFVEVIVERIEVGRSSAGIDQFLAETLDVSRMFFEVYDGLSAEQQEAVRERLALLLEPFTLEDGSVAFPGRSLVAAASA